MTFLSVLIPTYNRRERLHRTLSALEAQTCDEFDVYVSDNCSEYDIFSILNGFPESFQRRVHIKRNPINIGADSNIVNLFLNDCSNRWVWPLSDDDLIELNAVEKIKRDTTKYADAAWIDYPVLNSYGKLSGDVVFSSLEEQIDYITQFEKKHINAIWGNLVFLSNKIYNYNAMKQVLPYMFRYAYTHISTVLLLTKSLEQGFRGVVANDLIVKYDSTGGCNWNAREVLLGSRTFFDIDFNLSKDYLKKLYRIIFPYHLFRLTLIQILEANRSWKYPGFGVDVVLWEMQRKKVPHSLDIKAYIICLITRSKVLYTLAQRIFPRYKKWKGMK